MSKLRRACALMLACLVAIVVAPPSASADVPTREYCGSYSYIGNMRVIACVAFLGTKTVQYRATLENFGTTGATIKSLDVSSVIRGTTTTCNRLRDFPLAKGEIRSVYCSSTQISGFTYGTVGGFSIGSGSQTLGAVSRSPIKTA